MDNNLCNARNDCLAHRFILTALNPNEQYGKEFKAVMSFCPHTKRANSQGIHPILNQDKLHYTPAFILGTEKKSIKLRDRELFNEFHLSVRQTHKNNLKLQRPFYRRKCNVCQSRYYEYFAHISSAQHKEMIHSNLFNRYIIELVQLLPNTLLVNQKEATVVKQGTANLKQNREKQIKVDCQLKTNNQLSAKIIDESILNGFSNRVKQLIRSRRYKYAKQ